MGVVGGSGGAGGGTQTVVGDVASFIFELSGAGPVALILGLRVRVESESFGRSSSDRIRFFNLVPCDFFLEGR